MCRDNFASASSHYVNLQLQALWDNSVSCIKKEGHRAANDVVKRSFAFREFHGPVHQRIGKALFDVVFGTPSIEFLCGHELVLRLQIEKGQCHYPLKPEVENQELALVLSYKVDYPAVERLEAPSNIGIITIIQPNSARYLHNIPDPAEDLCEAIKAHYIPTLARDLLGLFILPASYDKMPIDHGVLTCTRPEGRDLFGIDISEVDEIFKRRWLAAISAHTIRKPGVYKKENSGDTYLADFHGYWNPDETRTDFWANIRFHPLRIRVLCDREVILFIKGDIYLQGEEDHSDHGEDARQPNFENWELAVIFKVSRQQNGHIVLENSERRRLAQNLCRYPRNEKLGKCFERSILTEYIPLIFTHGHIRLYPELPTPHFCQCGENPCVCGIVYGPLPKQEWEPPVSFNWLELRDEFIPNTHLHGYNRITTITQDGINTHFELLWNRGVRILTHFNSNSDKVPAHGDKVAANVPHFEAKFGAPRVELVVHKGSKNILIYFDVKEIKFACKDKQRTYHDWTLAVQFELELRDKDTGLARLVLKYTGAEFVHARSSFPKLVNTDEPRISRDLYETLGTNFVRRYVQVFCQTQNVLCELPVQIFHHSKGTSCEHDHGYDVSATDIGFSIVPFHLPSFGNKVYQGVTGPDHHIVQRNMIVFYAATGDGNVYTPVFRGPYGAPTDVPPLGTVLFSRDAFLDARIIKPLYKVNSLSALLCTLHIYNHRSDSWMVNLAPWEGQECKPLTEEDCQWEYKPALSDYSKRVYGWDSREEWRYDATGKGTTNATFTVTIITDNGLVIPTGVRDITSELSGSTTIEMRYNAHDTKAKWFGRLKVEWNAPITFKSGRDEGLSIDVQKFKPRWAEPHSEGADKFSESKNALDTTLVKFKEVFNKSVRSISDLLGDLKKDGIYKGLNMPKTNLVLTDPIFNANGDLLLRLRRQVFSNSVVRNTESPALMGRTSFDCELLPAPKLPAFTSPAVIVSLDKVERNEDKARAHDKALSPSAPATSSGNIKPSTNPLTSVTSSHASSSAFAISTSSPPNATSTPPLEPSDGHVQADKPAKELASKPSKNGDKPVGVVGETPKTNSVNGDGKAPEVTSEKPNPKPVTGTAKAAEAAIDKPKASPATRGANGDAKSDNVPTKTTEEEHADGPRFEMF